MTDIRTTLERIERRVSMPEPAMERLLRRRERRERNERIAAAVVGLGVAAAGIAGAFLTLRVARSPGPASGGAETAAAAETGSLVLPTMAIWTALAVLGLTAFALVRLLARSMDLNEDVDLGGREPGGVVEPARRPAAVPGTAPREGGSEMDSKQKGDVVGLPRTDMPQIRLDDGKLRRTNRLLVGAVIVLAVALVALSAWAIVDRSGTEDTVTAPPAETAPAIVPYTAGSIFDAEVAFDGNRCAYTGPTEIAAGTQGVIGFTGPERSGLTLASVAPDVTWEQVEGSAAYPPSDPPSWVTGAQNQIGSGTLRTDALGEGLYFLGCATGPSSEDQMFPAVMLRVIGA